MDAKLEQVNEQHAFIVVWPLLVKCLEDNLFLFIERWRVLINVLVYPVNIAHVCKWVLFSFSTQINAQNVVPPSEATHETADVSDLQEDVVLEGGASAGDSVISESALISTTENTQAATDNVDGERYYLTPELERERQGFVWMRSFLAGTYEKVLPFV